MLAVISKIDVKPCLQVHGAHILSLMCIFVQLASVCFFYALGILFFILAQRGRRSSPFAPVLVSWPFCSWGGLLNHWVTYSEELAKTHLNLAFRTTLQNGDRLYTLGDDGVLLSVHLLCQMSCSGGEWGMGRLCTCAGRENMGIFWSFLSILLRT